MQFAFWNILYLLWFLPVVLFLLFWSQKKRMKRLAAFSTFRLPDLMKHRISSPRVWIKGVFLMLAFILLVLSLARPRWGYEWKEVPKGGVDILVALDLSTSMLATDITPSRLERAKREVLDLLNLLEGDRIGIITFAGIVHNHCPLTSDYRLAHLFVNRISTDLMPVQGTKIGDAVNGAIDTLEKYSKADSQGKAIILITDGEDHETKPLEAAAKAKEKGIRLFVIGIGGEEGAPIPLSDGGFKKDLNGQMILSKLDEQTLKQMALTTGGIYVRSTSGDMDLDYIYKQGIRQNVADATYGSDKQRIWYERYQWFVLAAFLLLLLEFLFNDLRKKKTLIAFLLLLPCFSPRAEADPMKEAEKAFTDKNYGKAAEKFLEAEIDEPKVSNHSYNRSVSQFYNNDFDPAAKGFTQSTQTENPVIKENSFYNLGNTLVAKGELEPAIKAYDEALKINPQDKEALENKKWVEEQIKKKEQENKDKKDSDKDDKNKNKDKKDQDQKDKQEKDQDQKDKQEKEQDQKDKQEKEQDQKDQQDKQEKDKKEQDQQDKQAKEQKQEQINKEEAERLLRNLEDQEQAYGLPPKINSQTEKPTHDW